MALSLSDYLESLPEWKDDPTMRGLFASFSQPRAVNPEAWDARLAFWRQVLADAVRAGLVGTSCFEVSPSGLSSCFQRKGLVPLGLSRVLSEMICDRTLVPLAELDALDESVALRLLWWPVRAGLGWMRGDSKGPLVFPSLLQECADDILASIDAKPKHTCVDALLTRRDFADLVDQTRAKRGLAKLKSLADVDLLLRYMQSRQLIRMANMEVADGCAYLVIKLKSGDKAGLSPITKDQLNIVRLKAIEERLNEQIAQLTLQTEKIKAGIVDALSRKDKTFALHQLRRSKMLQALRDQRLAHSASIETILIRIHSSETDAQVIQAFRTGQATLHSILNRQAASAADVDDLMLDLSEALASQAQIESALAQDLSAGPDDAVLAQELDQLISAETEGVIRTVDETDENIRVAKTDGNIRAAKTDGTIRATTETADNTYADTYDDDGTPEASRIQSLLIH